MKEEMVSALAVIIKQVIKFLSFRLGEGGKMAAVITVLVLLAASAVTGEIICGSFHCTDEIDGSPDGFQIRC